MRSNDKKISISIRKYKKSSVIQLRRLPIKKFGDKKISTGDEPTPENIEKYVKGGLKEWQRIVSGADNEKLFREFAKEALAEFNLYVTKDTKNDREKHLREYINPTFGKMALGDITHDMVNPWQNKIKALRGADYAKRVKELFGRIIKLAVARGHIATDITVGTTPIKGHSKKIREIYSKEEVKLMLEYADGWLRVFIIVRVYLWLRSDEVVGLKWDDIDFIRKTLHVRRGIRWGRFVDVKGGERIIEIPPTALEALREHQKTSTSDWVFVTEKFDSYWSDCSTINKNYFQPLLKKIGIKYKSFYSLRHTGATLTLAKSGDWTDAQTKLGHKKLSTTTDYYIKPVAGAKSADYTEEALK